jgi:TusA-related sulfurtransferase
MIEVDARGFSCPVPVMKTGEDGYRLTLTP